VNQRRQCAPNIVANDKIRDGIELGRLSIDDYKSRAALFCL